MKKVLAIVFALSILLSVCVFAGCKTDDGTPSTPNNPNKPNNPNNPNNPTNPDPRLLYYVDLGSFCQVGVIENPMQPYSGKTELSEEEQAAGIVLAKTGATAGATLNSVTEQLYGADPVTGKYWGALGNYMSRPTGSTDSGYNTFRFASGDEPSENLDSGLDKRVLGYKFEVEDGTTELRVRLDFFNQWNERSFGISINGVEVRSSLRAFQKVIVNFKSENITGELIDGKYYVTVLVYSLNPTSSAGDPILNRIIIETMDNNLVI